MTSVVYRIIALKEKISSALHYDMFNVLVLNTFLTIDLDLCTFIPKTSMCLALVSYPGSASYAYGVTLMQKKKKKNEGSLMQNVT